LSHDDVTDTSKEKCRKNPFEIIPIDGLSHLFKLPKIAQLSADTVTGRRNGLEQVTHT